MYSFIFYVLYKANIKDGQFTAKFQACLITFFAIFLHLALVLAILKKIFIKQFESSGVSLWFNEHKEIYLLILALLGFFLYMYYNKDRIEKILSKYSTVSKSKLENGLKVIGILLIPIILAAFILTL